MKSQWLVYALMVAGLVAGWGCKHSSPEQMASGQDQQENAATVQTTDSTDVATTPKLTKHFVDGATAQAKEEYDNAAKHFRKALALDPHHDPSLFHLAEVLKAQEQYTEAQQYAERAVAADPDNFWYHDLLAKLYQENGAYKKAAQTVKEAIERFPDRNQLRVRLSDIYLKQAKYEKVLEIYDQLEAENGPSESIARQRKEIYSLMNKPQQAIQVLEGLIERNPTATEYYKDLYKLYQKVGNKQASIELLQQLLERDSDNAFALFKLVEHYQKEGRQDKAQALMERAFTTKNVSLEAKVQYLNQLMSSGQGPDDQERTGRLVRIVYENNPKEPSVLSLMGNYFAIQGKVDSAQHYYRKAVEIESDNMNVWRQLLRIDLQQDDMQALAEDSEAALVTYPNNPFFNYLNGVAHVRQGDYQKAVRPLEKYTMLNSNSADRSTLSQVHTLLGDAYQELEEPETAEQHYQQALSVDSTNQVAKNNYAYFLAVQGKSLDQALAMMEDVMATHPDNASYQDTYGWIFYKQGQYEKALKWVEKAYKQSASPEVAEHLGDIYYRLDQPEQAIQYWQEAQEKGRDSERLREKIESGKL